MGNVYFEQEQYSEATQEFQDAIKQGLDEADVYLMLGMSLMNQEQPKLALPYLQRASELEQEDVDIQFQYGLSLAYANLIEEALINLSMS